jgi:type IV pilus assembly protein PilO
MRHYDIKDIYKWPFGAQAAVLSVLAACVVYLGYLFNISELKRMIEVGYTQEQQLKIQYKNTLDEQANVKVSLSQILPLKQQLNDWQKSIITAKELPALLNQILKFSTADQLKFTLFDPGVEINAGEYQKIPLKIALKGTYDQILHLLSQVANMKQLVVLGNFILARNTDANGGSAKMTTAQAGGTTQNLTNLPLVAELTLEIYKR